MRKITRARLWGKLRLRLALGWRESDSHAAATSQSRTSCPLINMSSQQQVTTLQIDERPPEIILDRKLNLPWSLNPLFIWMKIFGFQLNGRPTSSSSKWFYCVGGGTLLINLILHLTSFIVGVKRLKSNGLGPNGTNLSTANLLNMGIEHLNYTFMLTGVHTIFFIISITYWKTLCNTVRAIDQSLAFKPKFYRRCRKAVVIGMTYIALVSMNLNLIYFIDLLLCMKSLPHAGCRKLRLHVHLIFILEPWPLAPIGRFSFQLDSNGCPERPDCLLHPDALHLLRLRGAQSPTGDLIQDGWATLLNGLSPA